MYRYTLTFGKHKGKSIEQLFFTDPEYSAWLLTEGVARARGFENELRALRHKAGNLNIHGICYWCQSRPIKMMAVYHDHRGGLTTVDFVCGHRNCDPHEGRPFIQTPSLLAAEHGRTYDKLGAKILIRAIRTAMHLPKVLRDADACTFFKNPDNFTV